MKSTPIFSTLDAACLACGVEPKERGGSNFIAANVEGSRHGRGAGRIKFFRDNSGGYVKNWTDGRDALFFYGYREGTRIPREEWNAKMTELAEARQEEEAARIRLQEGVATMAGEMMAAARPASSPHPYLVRKHVDRIPGAPAYEIDGIAAQKIVNAYPPCADGYRQTLTKFGARLLLVPMTVEGPAPVSLQLIAANGKKTFLLGGRVKGTLWRPEDLPARSDDVKTIGLCEGVATALSVRRLFGVQCLAGISAGNLIEAAKTARACYPSAVIQLYADRDAPTAEMKAKGREEGIGEIRARQAACAVEPSQLFVCPKFTASQIAKYKQLTGGDKPSDFNDLMMIEEAD